MEGKHTIVAHDALHVLGEIGVGSVDELRVESVLDELCPDKGLTPVNPGAA
jgi:hypothetical protein